MLYWPHREDINSSVVLVKAIMTAMAVGALGCATYAPAVSSGSPIAQRSSGFIRVGGADLYYETAGRGEPVVLLHGGWLNSRQWDEQIEPLSRQYFVVRYDARGYGRSQLGDSAYAHHDDLAALLRELGIGRAHLVALSNGTSIATEFALTYPAAVRTMVLGPAPLPGYDLGPEFNQGIRGIIGAGVEGDLEKTHRLMWQFPPFRVAATMPTVRARLDQMILREYTWSHNRPNAPRRVRVDPPPSRRFGEIKLPVLVITGDGEMSSLFQQADFIARTIPGARKVVIRGAGHFVNLEQPAEFTRVVLEWLQQHASGAASSRR